MFCCLRLAPVSLKVCLGTCLQQDKEELKKANIQNCKIENIINEHARKENNVLKILMLGTAESGKSTLIKQIKIIHSNGFSKLELFSFKPAVVDNLLTSMKMVLQGMGMLRINLVNKKNRIHAASILSCSQCLGDDQELLPFVAHAFCALWADQGVRAAAARGYQFDLNDSALYFFDNLSRIIMPNYIPTEADVLRVRVRTRGIIETQFQVNGIVFRLYDVGGQRTERRKWLSYFDGIHAALFVVSLSSYDTMLLEDPLVSRLYESVNLFSSLRSNPVLEKTSMILFLNKLDLFHEKIKHSERHLRLYLPTYRGPDGDVTAAAQHITAMFSACDTPNKPLYHHFTTATDTTNMQDVFHMVLNQIVRDNLAAIQLL